MIQENLVARGDKLKPLHISDYANLKSMGRLTGLSPPCVYPLSGFSTWLLFSVFELETVVTLLSSLILFCHV